MKTVQVKCVVSMQRNGYTTVLRSGSGESELSNLAKSLVPQEKGKHKQDLIICKVSLFLMLRVNGHQVQL
jgi:hypothetical protein